MFIYPIYNNNWRNISTIYIYKTRRASNEIFSGVLIYIVFTIIIGGIFVLFIYITRLTSKEIFSP